MMTEQGTLTEQRVDDRAGGRSQSRGHGRARRGDDRVRGVDNRRAIIEQGVMTTGGR